MQTHVSQLKLLSDDEVALFIERGFHEVYPCSVPPEIHRACVEQADTLCGGADAAGAHTMDTWLSCPALAEVCRDTAVRGALVSLLGERYCMEVHAASHYVRPHRGGQHFHQDGQFARFGGWNRHLRRWTNVRKVICFYYPHDVVSAPSEVLPGSHVWPHLPTAGALWAQQGAGAGDGWPSVWPAPHALTVRAGTFVIMHHNAVHRGTQETLGRRRVMLKLLFDRTEEPVAPSWAHQATPTWTDALLQRAPWVPTIYDWMCGYHGVCEPVRPSLLSQTDALIAQLIGGSDMSGQDPVLKARAAFTLGRNAPISAVAQLLRQLSDRCATAGAISTWREPDHGVQTITQLASAVATFGARASDAVRGRIGTCNAACAAERALLLDILLDCGGVSAASATGRANIRCFAACLSDDSADDWMRHAAVQGLEMSGTAGGKLASSAAWVALADPNPFVAFCAISALFNSGDYDSSKAEEGFVASLAARRQGVTPSEDVTADAMLLYKAQHIVSMNRAASTGTLSVDQVPSASSEHSTRRSEGSPGTIDKLHPTAKL
jgi:hypothetical protein